MPGLAARGGRDESQCADEFDEVGPVEFDPRRDLTAFEVLSRERQAAVVASSHSPAVAGADFGEGLTGAVVMAGWKRVEPRTPAFSGEETSDMTEGNGQRRSDDRRRQSGLSGGAVYRDVRLSSRPVQRASCPNSTRRTRLPPRLRAADALIRGAEVAHPHHPQTTHKPCRARKGNNRPPRQGPPTTPPPRGPSPPPPTHAQTQSSPKGRTLGRGSQAFGLGEGPRGPLHTANAA